MTYRIARRHGFVKSAHLRPVWHSKAEPKSSCILRPHEFVRLRRHVVFERRRYRAMPGKPWNDMAWEHSCPVRDSTTSKVVQRHFLNARTLGDSPETATEIVQGQLPFFPLASILLLLHPCQPQRGYKYHLGAESRLDTHGPE